MNLCSWLADGEGIGRCVKANPESGNRDGDKNLTHEDRTKSRSVLFRCPFEVSPTWERDTVDRFFEVSIEIHTRIRGLNTNTSIQEPAMNLWAIIGIFLCVSLG